MPLTQGSTLHHYEILAPLGAGAMGEVWRAHDPRLGRDVAVKVLPEPFATDEERLQRFEREARAVASLNHACVAQIHDVGQADDVCFLVLELVPGETLEARLSRGPLAVDEALTICARIADGLEAAHEAGIIHRDLKPANVRITPDGQVKLLDFGLARDTNESAEQAASSDSVLSTADGSILGTPTYMAPEQARGQAIDRRVDVWAFGCVVFECLTGRRAFKGDTLSDVLAAVLEHEPDWSLLPPLPPAVEVLLRRCLIKDARKRLRDVGEARLLFDEPSSSMLVSGAFPTAAASDDGPLARPDAPRSWTWPVIAGVSLLAAVLALTWPRSAGPVGLPGPFHVAIDPPVDTRIMFEGDLAGPPVVSPDGTTIAFAAARESEPNRLWVRRLDEPTARELPGTDGAMFPFWSPDGREVGFFVENALLRFDLATETATRIVSTGQGRGGAFTGDGRILYTPTFRSGLYLIDVEGAAEPVELTVRDEDLHTSHRWPMMIPGTDRFVFIAVTAEVGESDNDGLYLGDLAGGEPRRLTTSHFGGQVLDDLLLHVKDGSILATPLDVDAATLGAPSTVLARGLAPDASTWHPQFSASPAGALVFNRPPRQAPGEGTATHRLGMSGNRVSHRTYFGRPVTKYADATPMFSLALSPDNKTLAIDALSPDGYTDIWIHPTWAGLSVEEQEDIEEGRAELPAPRRLTFLPGPEYLPVWSPDGSQVAFRWVGDETRPRGLYRKRVGGGSETLVRDNDGADDHISAWSPDGEYLIVTTDTILRSELNDIIAVPLDGGPDVVLVDDPGAQYEGQVSPDGRWLAYVEGTDTASVFVVPFAPGWPRGAPDVRWLVSETGGDAPKWSQAGDALFFMTDAGVLMEVKVDLTGDTFSFSPPEALFSTSWRMGQTYAPILSQEGDSTSGFLLLDSDDAEAGPISVILGWPELLGDG